MVKRSFWKVCTLLLLVLSFAFGLAACSKNQFKVDFVVDGKVYATVNTNGKETIKMPADPKKEGEVFDGWYWDRDSWEKPFTANSLVKTPLTKNLSVYAKWASQEALSGTDISIKDFDKTGTYQYTKKVSSSTTSIALEQLVSVNSESTWVLSTDSNGVNTIASKTADLMTGENTFYITVTAKTGAKQVYTLKISRSIVYSVSFDTVGGSAVSTQQVEEGGYATAPETTKDGYDFAGWDFDFSQPITENKTITASWTAKQYAITYNLDGGENNAENPVVYTIESDTITLQAPTRPGYSFEGWYSDSALTASITTIPQGSFGDVEVYAKWSAAMCTIIYNKNGGSVSGSMANQEFNYADPVTLNANTFTRVGYTFATWNTRADGTGESYADASTIREPEANFEGQVNLYAIWTPLTYTVTFDKQGGEGGSDSVTAAYECEMPAAEAPAKSGCDFVGYFSEVTGGTKYYNADMSSAADWNIAGDATLYAQWTAAAYTIILDNQGGIGENVTTAIYGLSLPAVTMPVKDGYTFLGYYDAVTEGTQYYAADMTSSIIWDRAEGITLYARWLANTYIVSFDTCGGSGEQGAVVATIGEAMPEITVLPTKEGYIFGGYYDAVTGGTMYYNADLSSAAAWSITEDTTLYARWSGISYSVSFNANGGEGSMENQQFEYGVATELTANTYTRHGYEFAGWNTLANGTGTAYEDGAIMLDLTSEADATVTLYAQWSAILVDVTLVGGIGCTVSFDLNGAIGTAPAEQVVTDTVGLTYPAIPTRSGYLFAGWYATPDCTGTAFDFTAEVTNNITLYAKWVSYSGYGTISVGGNTGEITFPKRNTSEYRYYAFVPLVSERITIYSSSSSDTYGFLFDSSKTQLASDDDSGSNRNFQITYTVTAGQLYYIVPTAYSSTDSCTGTVYITGTSTPAAGGLGTGTGTVTEQVAYGQNYVLSIPSKTGWAFEGWYDGEDGTGTQYTGADGVGLSAWNTFEDTTLYAKWSRSQYVIIFNKNGGVGGTSNVGVSEGELLPAATAPTRLGYTFTGYYTSIIGGEMCYDADMTSSIVCDWAEDITLYAHWEIIEYTITFNNQGGEGAESVDITYGASLPSVDMPTKLGHTFLGYYDAATGGNQYYSASMTPSIWDKTESATLYAQWQANTYIVSFDANGGSGAHSSIEVTFGEAMPELTGVPTREGFEFSGYYDAAVNGNKYYNANLTSAATWSIAADTTLYAHWKGVPYYVNYNANGGSGTMLRQRFEFGIEGELNANEFTLTGYDFAGWNTAADGTGTAYADGANILDIAESAGETVELYAQWTAKVVDVTLVSRGTSCTVSFDLNGASGTAPAAQVVSGTTGLTYPAIPTRDGYLFAGWYTTSACTGTPYNFAAEVAGDITLYAKWVTYSSYASTIAVGNNTITIVGGDPTQYFAFVPLTSGTLTVTVGKNAYIGVSSTAPTSTTATVPGGAYNSNTYTVTAGTVYYVYLQSYYHYTSSSYVGSTYLNLSGISTPAAGGLGNGSIFDIVQLTYGQSFTLGVPTKTGYAFEGWYDGEGGTGVQYTDSTGASVRTWDKEVDTNLYAKWNVIEYTVTFDKQGGTGGTDSVAVTYGSAMPEATAPTKPGYTFVGYYTEVTGGTKYYNSDMTSAAAWTLTADTTLYARWAANTYTITFDNQGGAGAVSATATYGATLPTVTLPTRLGYTFLGYYDAPTGGTQYYAADMSASVWDKTEDTTLYAQWRANTYTVSFNTNGGSGAQTAVTVTFGEEMPEITVAPTKTGYLFDGYYSAITGGTKYYNADLSSAATWDIAADTTLFAQWNGYPYYVNFNANNGSGTMEMQEFEFGVSQALNANTFTRTGYDFDGWNTLADGTGTAYEEGALVVDLTSVAGATVQLYAQWTVKVVDVTLVATGVASPADVWDGTIATSYASGSGTSSDPYVIETGEQLAYLASQVNAGTTYSGYYFRLDSDIDLDNRTWTSIGKGTSNSWEYNTSDTLYFAGTFDGNGHTISNLRQTATTYGRTGLFGLVKNGTVTQLSLEAISINATNSGTNAVAGTLIGSCYNTTVSECSVSGSITLTQNGSNATALGGIIGSYTGGSISNCVSTVTMSCTASSGSYNVYSGGVVGRLTGVVAVSKCLFNGDMTINASSNDAYASGIVGLTVSGSSSSTIRNCVSVGTIRANGNNCYADGVYRPWSGNTISVSSCYYNVTFIKNGSSSTSGTYGTYSTITNLQSQSWLSSTLGWDFADVWTFVDGNDYPVLQGVTGSSVFDTVQLTYGQSFTLGVPTRTGYTFEGWYDGEGGTGTQYTDSTGVSVRAWDKEVNSTLYAKWSVTEYTVTFDKQGGTGGSDSVSATYGSAMPEATAPTKAGYTFAGYYTAVSGGTKYYNADMTSAATWTRTEDITLYARWTAATYTITFDNQGGSGAESTTVVYGTGLPTVTKPVKAGNTFLGYYDAPTGGNCYYDADMGSSIVWNRTEGITLYAQWQVIEYTVSFNTNGGSGAQASVTVTYGAEMPTITVTPTKDGFTFAGYYSAITGGTKYYNADLTGATTWAIEGNATLYAHWTGIPYYVNFNANNGEGTMERQEFEYGVTDTLNANEFTRTGYDFNGWNTLADGTGTAYSNGASVLNLAAESGAVVQLYAQWTAKVVDVTLVSTGSSYTVSFDLNGASGTAPAAQTVTATTGLTYPAIPTRSGYLFAGWYTTSACTGTPYNFTAQVTSDITLYAKWVTYSSYASTIAVGNNTITIVGGDPTQYFAFVPLTSGTLTVTVGKNAYIGVSSTAPTSTTATVPGGAYNSNTYTVTAGTVYYVYLQSYLHYTTSAYVGSTYLNLSGISTPAAGGLGNGAIFDTVQLTYGQNFTLGVPTRIGGTFEGWYDGEGGTGTQYTDSTGASVRTWDKEVDTNLYAKWSETVYTVTFDKQGGTGGSDSVAVTYGSAMPEATAPTKTGYDFAGYYTAISGGTKYYNADMTSAAAWALTADTTLYARWTAATYTITLDNQGGTGAESATAVYGLSLPTITKPVKAGNTFLGYYDAPTGGTQYYNASMGSTIVWNRTEGITLYAQWQVIVYEVSFNTNGGSGAQTAVNVTYGSDMPTITVAPTKTGYIFDGYYSALTGGTKYYNADLTGATTWAIEGNATLYAHWVGIPYYINFNANNGEGTMESQEFEYGVTDTLNANEFTRTGYDFAGWNTLADGTGTSYSNGASIYNLTNVQGTVIELFAQWTAKTVTVTLTEVYDTTHVVTFNLNGASGTAPAAQTVTDTVRLTYPTKPTRSGYLFGGWYTTPSCTGTPYNFTAQVTSDITLYAKWLYPSSYTKVLSIGGNTGSTSFNSTIKYYPFVSLVDQTIRLYTSHTSGDPKIYLYNSNKTQLAVDDDGYTTSRDSLITYTVTAGTLYYAGFGCYSSSSGTGYMYLTGTSTPSAGGLGAEGVFATTQLTYDQNFSLAVPTQTGCSFEGWYDGVGGTGTQYTDSTGASVRTWDKEVDTTLYAKWNTVEYTISYNLNGGVNNAANPASYNINTPTITLAAPTKTGYSFIGWTSDTVSTPTKEYTIAQGSTGNVNLTANWVEYDVNPITYDSTVNTVSMDRALTAEWFGAQCYDTDEIAIDVIASYVTTPVAGQTVSVLLHATSGGKTVQTTIENVKVYTTPTITISNTSIKDTDSIVASTFGATAVDSFGVALDVEIELIEGSATGGGNRTYSFTATDCVNNVSTVSTVISVYSAADITFAYNDTLAGVRVGSTGTEFGAVARDTYGGACTLNFEVTSGNISTAGSTVNVRFTATDVKGNISTLTINNVKVYGTPAAYIYIGEVTPATNSSDIYIVKDSFGEDVAATITYVTNLVAGQNVSVNVVATDVAGNVLNETYEVPVVCSSHSIGLNCACESCRSIRHTASAGSCICAVCKAVYHPLDEDCVCTNCGVEFHDYNEIGICKNCHAIESTVDVWDGTVATSYASGNGTSSNPYVIETGAQLAYLASQVNAGTTYSGTYFRLDSDIDLNNRTWTSIGRGSANNSEYSSSETKYFAGNFDGNGHTVSNLRQTSATYGRTGLFGYLKSASISKLAIESANINVTNSSGTSVAGILSGLSYSTTISQCSVSGSITVTHSSSNASFVGGMTGVLQASTISDCVSTATVSATNSSSSYNAYVGGFIGGISGTNSITRCYFKGNVTATKATNNSVYASGILGVTNSGTTSSTISNCVSSGTIRANGSTNYIDAIYRPWSGNTITVSSCYYNATLITGTSTSASSTYGTSTTLSNLQSQSWLSSTLGWDFTNIWTIDASTHYPVLKAFI